MTDRISAKWDELFGKGWKEIMKICPEIGGFMLDRAERTAVLDDNAAKLAETDSQPDYDAMVDYLDILSSDNKAFARLLPQLFYDDGEFAAGILRWHYDFSGEQAKNVVPMFERSQLVSSIKQAKKPSLLALLNFEMSDKSEPGDARIFGSLAAVISVMPEGAAFCSNYGTCFWLFVPEFSGDGEALINEARIAVASSGQADGIAGKNETGRYMTFEAGIGTPDGSAEQRMSTAEFALYQADIEGPEQTVVYSSEQYEIYRGDYEKMSKFSKLVNENLFIYHFQPIVSAKDGSVVAYEMLMRSDPSIGMYPLEILDCADKAKRLYDIEKATLRNALSIMEKNQDVFKTKKLFVNSITAHMLTDEDWNALVSRYGELMEKMVIEFTEQTEINDESIESIRMRLLSSNIKCAIDDFGTGYSNTSNLIRYSPDFVKIDRTLIEGINNKPNVRKLVSGIVEFIHANGYQALAEGVETYEELQVVIQLGCDLIQGYYVSKPKPIMLYEVSDGVCRDIETINLINTTSISRPYYPENGETVDLCMIKSDGYSSVFIEVGEVKFVGRSDIYLDTVFIIKGGIETKLSFENVRVKTEREAPAISLGDGSKVDIDLIGENILDGKGIYVPESASLRLAGDGSLEVISNLEDCYAIGVTSLESPGNIVIDMTGKLTVRANGDVVVGIGGGKNESSTAIRLLGGKVAVYCSGRSCVGVGISSGNAIVDIDDCECEMEMTAPEIVGVGATARNVDISIKNSSLKEVFSGIRIAGIGTIEYGSGRISLYKTVTDDVMKGRIVNCIGTRSGNTGCHLNESYVTLYCESGSVSGVGDMFGSGDVSILRSKLNFDFRTGDGFAYGSRTGITKCEQTEETIKINE